MSLFDILARQFTSKATEDIGTSVDTVASGDTKKIAGTLWDFLAPIQLQALLHSPEAKAMFIGRKALGGFWDTKKVAPTYEMTKRGATADEIWEKLRTYVGPEGRMRQEISDMGSSMLPVGRLEQESGKRWNHLKQDYDDLTAADFISYEKFAKAYPDIMKYKVKANRDPGSGQFDPNTLTIEIPRYNYFLNQDKEATLSTFLHELQHAVQNKEGFARGGSPEEFNVGPVATKLADVEKAIIDIAKVKSGKGVGTERTVIFNPTGDIVSSKKLKNLSSEQLVDEFKYLAKKRKELHAQLKEDSFESYMRLAGEAEARATARRRWLSEMERLEVGPSQFYDRPPHKLIVK